MDNSSRVDMNDFPIFAAPSGRMLLLLRNLKIRVLNNRLNINITLQIEYLSILSLIISKNPQKQNKKKNQICFRLKDKIILVFKFTNIN